MKKKVDLETLSRLTFHNQESRVVKTYIRAHDVGNEWVGTVALIVDFKEEGRPSATIEDMEVSEDYQSRGIGSFLVNKAIQLAKTQYACYKIVLICDKEVIPFYRNCGEFYEHQQALRMDLHEENDAQDATY